MVLCSWVDPEDEEDMNREVEAGKSTEEKVAVGMKDKGEMVNNGKTSIKDDEKVVIDVEMEELQPLNPKK